MLQDRLKRELRSNGYDAASGTLKISDDRAAAVVDLDAGVVDADDFVERIDRELKIRF